MKWVKFNEDDRSTYPPLETPVLISFNTNSYYLNADQVGWASLNRNYMSDDINKPDLHLHWFLDNTTGNVSGTSPLENSTEAYGQYESAWIFVTYWALLEPYVEEEE